MEGRKRSLDPPLLWARDKYLGLDFGNTSRELVIRELRKTFFSIVDELLEETGQEEPEFKPELLAPKRRIKDIIEAPLSKVRALLTPEIGGFVLKIKSDMHLFQKRFSCSHEIGHTFFFNIDSDPPRKEFSYQKSRYWVEEEFSNAIAREILVPSDSIREIVQKECPFPSISALRYLSKKYQVSDDVLRLKLINDMSLWDCIFFRASLFDDKVITKKRDISKGISYRNVHIPHIVKKNSEYFELFTVISSTIKEKRVRGKKVNINGKEYIIETRLLNYKKPTMIGILTTSAY